LSATFVLDYICRFSIGVPNGGGEIRLEGVRAEALEQQKRKRQEKESKPNSIVLFALAGEGAQQTSTVA
jgi:hypothetical protein